MFSLNRAPGYVRITTTAMTIAYNIMENRHSEIGNMYDDRKTYMKQNALIDMAVNQMHWKSQLHHTLSVG